MSKRVYMKYVISKADGSPVDPDACYFVLRLDKDPAARKAARVYAHNCGNAALEQDLIACVDWLDHPPECTCGGGRDRDVTCPFHDGPGIGMPHPVWRAGSEPDDICGLCGQPGADKIPHPVYWPGERRPITGLVHQACEDEECRRAHTALTPAERESFLRSII
jgi:hypothetical protein